MTGQTRAPSPGTRPSVEATASAVDSSGRENVGESSTTGPEKCPPATISRAMLAPMLWPTTVVQPCSAAKAPVIAA